MNEPRLQSRDLLIVLGAGFGQRNMRETLLSFIDDCLARGTDD